MSYNMYVCMYNMIPNQATLSLALIIVSSLNWLYSKLGLTQEFVVDCAHALWVVHSNKGLSLMLLNWFLSDSFIYFMYRMLNENFE